MTLSSTSPVFIAKYSIDFEFPEFLSLPAEMGRRTFGPVVEMVGRRWRLVIYPGGDSESSRDHVSCCLQCLSFGNVSVSFRVSVINSTQSGKHVTHCITERTFRRTASLSNDSKTVSEGFGWSKFISRTTLLTKASEFLVNNTLVIRLDLMSTSPAAPHALPSVHYNFLALQNDESTTDVELHVVLVGDKKDKNEERDESGGDRTRDENIVQTMETLETSSRKKEEEKPLVVIKAHRLVLSAFSEVFKTMLYGPMREAHTNKLIIEDFSLEAVQCMVDFCYSGEIDLEKFPHSELFELIFLSSKYQMSALTSKCCGYLLDILSTENAIEILDIANRLSLTEFKAEVMKFIADHSRSTTRDAEKLKVCDKDLLVEIIQAAAFEDKFALKKRKFDAV